MNKYDKLGPDVVEPLIFHEMNCCPICSKPSLVILDHEFDMTSISRTGHIGEVLSCQIDTEIACTECGFKTKMFALDSEGRIKLCTEAEMIHENYIKDQRIKKRAEEVAKAFVGLKSAEENPFGNWEVTHF